MRIKEGWTLTEVDGEYVAVPVSEPAKGFMGVVKMNITGRDIWNGLADGLSEDTIASILVDKYDGVDKEKALENVRKVSDQLRQEGLLVD